MNAQDMDVIDAEPVSKEVLKERANVAQKTPIHKSKPLKCIDIADFLDMVLPVASLILGEWFAEKSLSMIYAWRGLGKTWFVLSMAYAISCGEKFIEWEVKKPRRVLILDGEMQGFAMQKRLAHIAEMFDREPAQGFLTILTPDLQNDRGMPDLSTLEGQFELESIIEQVNPQVIVVDNLSSLCRTGRENEGESWLVIADWALRMRREGRSVVFVHHSGKSGQQRGSSRREDILDNVIALKKLPESDAKKGAHFEVTFEKARHTNGGSVESLELTLASSADGKNLHWEYKKSDTERKKRIEQMVADGMTYDEIGKELNISKSSVCRILKGEQ